MTKTQPRRTPKAAFAPTAQRVREHFESQAFHATTESLRYQPGAASGWATVCSVSWRATATGQLPVMPNPQPISNPDLRSRLGCTVPAAQ
jgi:hypothetical protein